VKNPAAVFFTGRRAASQRLDSEALTSERSTTMFLGASMPRRTWSTSSVRNPAAGFFTESRHGGE
jgi:hypothetical protein